jgi:acetyl esterase/lipase
MFRSLHLIKGCLALAMVVVCAPSNAQTRASTAPAPQPPKSKSRSARFEPPQETGFLNRRLEFHGANYRFQVYLPEEWRRDDRKQWPIILFLHGRGERGAEGMWQTQIGLPQAVRDHPDRWPFIIVMPQCPIPDYWTDPDIQLMAMAALDQETTEFHADPERTYLTGISLGGYGAWELAREYPHRWAAIAIAASGIFWSYAPERWQQSTTLPGEYARPLGRTPVWLFHGADDTVVKPRESELMFDALKAAGGHVRYWLYLGYPHDCWFRAYDEPDLPKWFLLHRVLRPDTPAAAEPPALAERVVIPFHPPAIKLAQPVLESLVGDYRDSHGRFVAAIYLQQSLIFERNQAGDSSELAAESPGVFFYLNGSATTRLIFERDGQGHVVGLTYKDDRHEEHWEKHSSVPSPAAH